VRGRTEGQKVHHQNRTGLVLTIATQQSLPKTDDKHTKKTQVAIDHLEKKREMEKEK